MLPYASLEIEDRKAAHTLLRTAYRLAESGDEKTCFWLGGAIVRQFILRRKS
jgi:hypothetical protein